MAKLVTIIGGSGFVGRQIARQMAQQGWRVRVAVRRPNEALFVRTYGAVGQVEPVLCNIRDEVSLRAAMIGADAVVNCVGILVNEGRNRFDDVQAEGAGRVARLATELGVENLVQISAIGADAESDSDYARSKAAGEAAVLREYPRAVVLRPSVVFGNGDGIYTRMARLIMPLPIMFIGGGETKFQPVYVEDVARAAVLAASGQAAPGIYELGGPDVLTLREITQQVLDTTRRSRRIVNLPNVASAFMAVTLDFASFLTGGLFTNRVLTRDQVRLLDSDNVVSGEFPGFEAFGIVPTSPEAIIETYLWPFRPQGQYTDMTASARKLPN